MNRHPGWPVWLAHGRVGLRPPRLRDGPAWSALRQRNDEWLSRWEPTSPESWPARHGTAAWPPMLSSMRRAARAGGMLPFVVTYDGLFVGQVSVNHVVRGAMRSAQIGYWVDQDHAGQGIIPAAVALATDHCLGPVGLHRIQVDIRPENAASRRVMAKLGFREEGYFERYLDIDGAWRDHVTYALTLEEIPDGLLQRLPHPAE